jgi:2-keto-4-pentenoate hydratase
VQQDAADPFPDQVAETIARAFVAARQSATALADYPGPIPPTLVAAYRVQDRALTIDGRVVAGWKVGRINPPRDGIDRLAGPIFGDQIVDAASAGPIEMPVFAGGFAAAEAEFLLRIGTMPDPAQTHFSLAEAAALVDAVHVGIEIASSPFPGINVLGPTVTISDFGNNNGLVVGPEVDAWREADIDAWPVALTINGAPIGAGRAADMLDGPVGAVRFLLELAAIRGRPLAAGTWISSGAVTGVHAVAVGDRVEARFGEGLLTGCTIIAQ